MEKTYEEAQIFWGDENIAAKHENSSGEQLIISIPDVPKFKGQHCLSIFEDRSFSTAASSAIILLDQGTKQFLLDFLTQELAD